MAVPAGHPAQRRGKPARFVFAACLCLLVLQGCAGMYFREAGPAPTVQHAPDAWPYREYWTGIVFNGNRIGFTHLEFTPGAVPGTYEIRSTASLRFHFLGLDKEVRLLARDVVSADLTLRAFEYDYNLDGNRMQLSGSVEGSRLRVDITTAGGTDRQELPVEAPLYPTSAVNLLPSYLGIAPGKRYAYRVYDGETRRIAEVTQEVLGWEESELFEGQAYRIRTRMHGTSVTTWINARAEPVLEMSMNGIFIAGLEDRDTAQRYLAEAALAKDETLLKFSLVRTDRPIADPRGTREMEIVLAGFEEPGTVPSDGRQRCENENPGRVRCRIAGSRWEPSGGAGTDASRYLESTLAVPARHPYIRQLAAEITAGITDTRARLAALLDWIGANIAPEPADVFTAVDVLDQRRAECQGYSFLFASFARSLGIPARVVNGLVYSGEHGGFLYHTWVESLVDGAWQAIDPTFGQIEADATHVKLVEGEGLAELAPLINVVGRLSAEIVSLPE